MFDTIYVRVAGHHFEPRRVLRLRRADPIDDLIRPPRRIYTGFDWTRTDKLIPNGDAANDRLLGERLQPPTELRGGIQ